TRGIYRPARRCACRVAGFRFVATSFGEISSPPCVKQRRSQTSSWGSKKKLHTDTLSLRPVFEMKMKLLQAIFEEQVEEICLADSGGPGLGSVRQSLFVLEPVSYIGGGSVAGWVLMDRAQKLA